MQRRPVQRERIMQAAIVRWARRHADLYPPLRWLFAVPNGGHRDAIEAANLKREGVTPGVSDLCLLHDNGEYAALWMELKIGSNRLSPAQREFQAWAESQGHQAVVCRTTQEAIEQIRAYLAVDDPFRSLPALEGLDASGDASFPATVWLHGAADTVDPDVPSAGGRATLRAKFPKVTRPTARSSLKRAVAEGPNG